jgi:LmbE family N-acetylglucosaminyl deacetylase
MALTSRSAALEMLALDDDPKPTGFVERRRANLGHAHVRSAPERVTPLPRMPSPGDVLLRLALEAEMDGRPARPVDNVAFLDGALSARQDAQPRRRGCKKVLAIGAHPDDIEIGCGGAMAKHKAQGDELMILTLSRGAIGGDSAIRAQEAELAAQLLGARLQLGDLPDTKISDGVVTIDVIQDVIRSFAPTHIYTHSLHDAHQDHRSAHTATLAASRGVKNVYAYQSPSSTVDFRPNHFVDITEYIDRKIRVLAAHESQVTRSTNLRREFMVATALYWGRYIGHTMAEPMEVVRQLDS